MLEVKKERTNGRGGAGSEKGTNERAGRVLEVNEKEMNGAAHATLCTVWPHAFGAQATGTSALDAAFFHHAQKRPG